MSSPNKREMHPRKIFIRQCEKLGKFLENWMFRAMQKKAGILHNLWKVGKCARQSTLAIE